MDNNKARKWLANGYQIASDIDTVAEIDPLYSPGGVDVHPHLNHTVHWAGV